jgi:hypothetical protein
MYYHMDCDVKLDKITCARQCYNRCCPIQLYCYLQLLVSSPLRYTVLTALKKTLHCSCSLHCIYRIKLTLCGEALPPCCVNETTSTSSFVSDVYAYYMAHAQVLHKPINCQAYALCTVLCNATALRTTRNLTPFIQSKLAVAYSSTIMVYIPAV